LGGGQELEESQMSALDSHLEFTAQTESPTQFHRWTFLSAVGASLGRRVWLPFGHRRVYPNMYCLLVGVPATRKSTAIAICRGLLEDSLFNKFAFTRTTREKFLIDFEDGFDVRKADGKIDMVKLLDAPIIADPNAPLVREVYISCSEFVDFIGRNATNFIDLMTNLWDNLPSYQERLKNSKSVNIMNPTVSLLGGITPSTLAEALPPSVVGQGFMSRLILVFSNPSKTRITWPPPPDEKVQAELVDFFRKCQTLQGEAKLHKDASDLLDRIYQSWPNLNDIRLQYYCGRRFEHLLKLCMICAACRGTLHITADVVIEANTILTYTERNMHLALGEFGESRNSKAAQKVMESIALADKPLDFNAIWKTVSMDLERRVQLQELLQNLVQADKLELIHVDNKAYVKLKERKSSTDKLGVDYGRFIREYEPDKPKDTLNLLDTGDEEDE
jgi:hypothetical protein